MSKGRRTTTLDDGSINPLPKEYRVPYRDSRIFIVNNVYQMKIDELRQYAGPHAEAPIVLLHNGSMEAGSFHTMTRMVEVQLETFRPDHDILLIAGRSVVNFSIGVLFQRRFPGRRINVLEFDARYEDYHLTHIELPSDQVF